MLLIFVTLLLAQQALDDVVSVKDCGERSEHADSVVVELDADRVSLFFSRLRSRHHPERQRRRLLGQHL